MSSSLELCLFKILSTEKLLCLTGELFSLVEVFWSGFDIKASTLKQDILEVEVVETEDEDCGAVVVDGLAWPASILAQDISV